jgi:uncharacterized membrane protein YeaQ/YmgE (transglycosylase-associated protein family)
LQELSIWRWDLAPGRKQVFGILGWILFGLVAGILAKLIMPGRDPGGFIVTILLGIAGAVVGGFIGQAIGLYQQGQAAGMIMSIIGAIVLLAIYRMVVGPRSKPVA